jgi:hypothetical protein
MPETRGKRGENAMLIEVKDRVGAGVTHPRRVKRGCSAYGGGAAG